MPAGKSPHPLGIWLSGMAAGCGLMYWMDPRRGSRRRAVVRDKLVHVSHQARIAADKTTRDFRHRAWGFLAELGAKLQAHACDDEVLVARVRSRLGRACSHPTAIEVAAFDGHITLRGPVLESEAALLLHQVRQVAGVRAVEDRLERHQSAGDIPGLQGGSGRRHGRQLNLLRSRWAPSTRLLAGAGGGVLLARGLRRGGPLGTSQSLLGAGLLLRAATNLETRRLLGAGPTRSAVRMQKTLTIHAPIEQVFQLWAHPENFSRFMAHVKSVHCTANGHYRWTVSGPAGLDVSWEAAITRNLPNQVLAWKSVPGAAVGNAGIVRFESESDGATRLHILLSYNPPGGAIGHAFASIFGSDPMSVMHEDLARMKSLLEVGKTRAHGEVVTRGQVMA